MTVVVPWKTVYIGQTPVGAAEYAPGDVIPLMHGGTGVADIAALKALLGIANHVDLQHNWLATVAPTSTDDSAANYSVGSRWLNAATVTLYTCVGSDVGAAVWKSEAIADLDNYLAFGSSEQVSALELRALLDAGPDIRPVIVGDDVVFIDATRSKALSVSSTQYSFARDKSKVSDVYLETVGGISSSLTGYALIHDATLIGISLSGARDDQTWDAEVRKNNVLAPLLVAPLANSFEAHDSTLDVDFDAGDRIQVFCAGTNIARPLVTLQFRRRHA